jgi:hypothetical protein
MFVRKNSFTSSGMKPETFRLVAQYLHHTTLHFTFTTVFKSCCRVGIYAEITPGVSTSSTDAIRA